MKLLSIAIPSYNSEAYLHKAVESLLPGGDEVEILIVNDGSKDRTAEIADDYERRYPGIVRAIHKENGGHGDAVMTGLAHATGMYFKVVDSDDWIDADAYPRVLAALRAQSAEKEPVDLLICNYIYDKVGAAHKHVVRYGNALPEGKAVTWEEIGAFRVGQYILMHAAIYRTQVLRESGMTLPKHTFYVDNLYVYAPMPYVKRLMYLSEDLYHYFIGRDDQSVQESVMLHRVDQQLLVNRLLLESVDLEAAKPARLREYLFKYAEIITTISSVLLIIGGTEEHMRKKDALWADIRARFPYAYKRLRWGLLGMLVHLPGRIGRRATILGYKISQKLFGFN